MDEFLIWLFIAFIILFIFYCIIKNAVKNGVLEANNIMKKRDEKANIEQSDDNKLDLDNNKSDNIN